MRDTIVTIQDNGTAGVYQPKLYEREHNSTRLVVVLNSALSDSSVSSINLQFDLYGLNRRFISNSMTGATGEGPAYRLGNSLFFPLPEALTATGELTGQVEAVCTQDGVVQRVIKSGIFTLRFEPSLCGNSAELDEACGLLPQLMAALEKVGRLEDTSGYNPENPPVIAANPCLSAMGAKGDLLPTHLTVGSRDESWTIGEQSCTVGSGNAASGTNACAMGSGVKTQTNHSFIVGQNATAETDALFTVGNGYSQSSPSSAFSVTRTRIYADVPLYALPPVSTDNSNLVATTSFVRNNTHTHTNNTVLQQLGEDVSGSLTYKGASVGSGGGTGGVVYIPEVSDQGILSWTNNGGLSNPSSMNIRGAQGEKGDTGAAGAQGVQGIQGIQGSPGEKGEKGETGAQGIQGVKGDTGVAGVKGEKGDTGAQGVQGIPGEKGDPGAGIPAGGTIGQALVKSSNADYAAAWVDMLPACSMTQAAYNALSSKNAGMLYVIAG